MSTTHRGTASVAKIMCSRCSGALPMTATMPVSTAIPPSPALLLSLLPPRRNRTRSLSASPSSLATLEGAPEMAAWASSMSSAARVRNMSSKRPRCERRTLVILGATPPNLRRALGVSRGAFGGGSRSSTTPCFECTLEISARHESQEFLYRQYVTVRNDSCARHR